MPGPAVLEHIQREHFYAGCMARDLRLPSNMGWQSGVYSRFRRRISLLRANRPAANRQAITWMAFLSGEAANQVGCQDLRIPYKGLPARMSQVVRQGHRSGHLQAGDGTTY